MAERDDSDFRKPTEPRVPDPGSGGNKVMTPGEKRSATARRKREEAAREEEDAKLIRRAVKRFKRALEAESDNRAKALEDLKFKAGEQWPADVRAQRTADKRPCLTINDMPTFTHQIENDIRQNRPGINISPAGMKATKDSAEIYAGKIRAIERDSAGEIAYDTAIISAIDIGFGYFRILTEYESEKSFDQEVVIKRVRNPFTVLLDPERQEPDGCDAKWAFVSELIDREEFRDRWPGAAEVPWSERGIGEEQKHWVTQSQIRVAEYFVVSHDMRTLVALDSGHVGYRDELDESVLSAIESGRVKVEQEREVEVQSVMWYRITGAEVLERQEWLGKWIPIVEVIGDEIDIEGRVIRSGVIRNAKDPARIKNYWTSAKTEYVALQPKAPYIGAEGSFDGHENEWKVANVKSQPYLEYVPVLLENGQYAPPPTRAPPPQVPQGYVEAEQSAQQDKMRTTGIRFDASLSERVYDESGKALHELRRNTDIGSFHYSDNLKRSLRHAGRIYIDLIQKLAVRQKMTTVVNEDGTDSLVRIDPASAKALGKVQIAPDAPPLKVFNPKVGEYEVSVTIGPSYATRRIEAQESMTKLMHDLGAVNPQGASALAPLVAKYSDWPGSTEAHKALLATIPPQMQVQDLGNLPPQAQAMIVSLQRQIQTMTVEKAKLLKEMSDQTADRMLTKENIDRTFEAKMAKIYADMQKEMLKINASVTGEVQKIVEAVRSFEAGLAQQQSIQPNPGNGGTGMTPY